MIWGDWLFLSSAIGAGVFVALLAAGTLNRRASDDEAEAIDILSDIADPDDCYYDHHGYCQAHGWFETDPECPHKRAKERIRSFEAAS